MLRTGPNTSRFNQSHHSNICSLSPKKTPPISLGSYHSFKMHLVRVLGYTLLLVSNVILAAGADAAYIKSSLLNMTADIDVIKATASTIDTNLDFLSYQVGGGKYKQVQDKLNALTTKAGTYSSQIQGSSVSSPTDIDEIVNSFQVLGIELIATLGVLIDKAGAFATTPLLGQDISNSIGGFEGGFGVSIYYSTCQVDSRPMFANQKPTYLLQLVAL